MKKVIDGKMYNTETADEVASHSYGYQSDFNYIEETLYRTKKGAWFLYGEGGANTRYSRAVSQNSWTGGDGWEVLSEKEALDFCERHADPETIEKYFGDKIEEA